MKTFINENFLLKNETARKLYKEIETLPIIDYHCHLIPSEIASNKKFSNITQLWLYGDHYKWRAMRTYGIDEKYITGDASDFEKFEKWSETLENCIGNPLYHWTHLELKRYFNYDGILTKNNCKEVFEHCNSIINDDSFSVNNILKNFNVETICTTDDPIDDLAYHSNIKANSSFNTKVLPTFRPSLAMNIEKNTFLNYINKLSNYTNIKINSYSDIINALYTTIDIFDKNGCKLADHALDPLLFCEYTNDELNNIVAKALNNESLDKISICKYKTALLHDLSLKYYELNWVSQLHIGTLRDNNSKMFNLLGSDTGFDCMDDMNFAKALTNTLNKLNEKDKLCKTIIYCLNPIYNDMIVTAIGCFQSSGIKGKIQFGSGWWFNDQKDGMEKQMISLANNGMLSCFVGMLTDSRSFLSYTRHEYFRRILCNLIGSLVEDGEYPNDFDKLREIVQNICYYNAKNYFNF